MIAVSTPKTTPSSGSSPYAPLPITPEISTTPTNTTGIEASERFSGRSPSASPGEQSHEDDLDVAEHGREPGAHRLDRVVPEGEVGGEHDARSPERQPRRAAGAGRSGASSTQASSASTGSAYAQRKNAAVEGDTSAQAHEDRREGDHERAEHAREYRPVGHGERD